MRQPKPRKNGESGQAKAQADGEDAGTENGHWVDARRRDAKRVEFKVEGQDETRSVASPKSKDKNMDLCPRKSRVGWKPQGEMMD